MSNLPPPRTSNRVDVLLVDDLEEFTRVVSRALLLRGLSVVAAPSTLHAIRALEQRPVCVVVTDLLMPGPSGSDLLAVVERRWPLTRRVLLSSFVGATDVLETPCAHRVLDKSVGLEQIVEVVLEELALASAPL